MSIYFSLILTHVIPFFFVLQTGLPGTGVEGWSAVGDDGGYTEALVLREQDSLEGVLVGGDRWHQEGGAHTVQVLLLGAARVVGGGGLPADMACRQLDGESVEDHQDGAAE